MSASLFDLYIADLCPDEFRAMVRTSNEYPDLLTRFLDGDVSVTETACLQARRKRSMQRNQPELFLKSDSIPDRQASTLQQKVLALDSFKRIILSNHIPKTGG